MPGRADALWRLLPDVRSGERDRFAFFAGLFTLITLAQTLGLAGMEALFLSQLGAEGLRTTYIYAAVGTVLASMVYAVRVGVVRNDLIFFRMTLVVVALLAAAAWGVHAGWPGVLEFLFCAWFATQTIFLNHFWTFSGDYFDRVTNKRLVPLFTIASSLGGALGGLLAAALAWLTDPLWLVVAWAVVLTGAAALIRATRRPLRRWGPLELEEADETSVAGLRAALRFLQTSKLARWLAVSALGMVLSFFLAQYLYSLILVDTFPEAGSLAVAIALYLAFTNLIEIGLEVGITPRLIRRLGVPGANLAHPLLMMVAFGVLAAQYSVAAALLSVAALQLAAAGAAFLARGARELADNAVAAPVRSLMQNAIPARFRGRVRAFLEGMVVYAGMAAAGALLVAIGEPDPLALCALGGAASALYFFANWRARRAYLDTLLAQLRAGRMDLDPEGSGLGGWEATRLAELWEAALEDKTLWPSAALIQLVPALAKRGLLDPLIRAASHPNAEVRRASVTALASTGSPSASGPLALSLDDPDAPVRLAALRGLARVGADRAFFDTRVDDLLQDLDPRVRAEAASLAGERGREILGKMITSPRPDEAEAALRVASVDLLDHALDRVESRDPRTRAAALECVARLATDPPLEQERLFELLRDEDASVRRAAVLVLANLEADGVLTALAGCLTDPAAEVQLAAEWVLASHGEAGVAAAEPYLGSELERAVMGALRVVERSGVAEARQILSFELRRRVALIWWYLIGYQMLSREATVAARFLRLVFRDAMLRERRLAFGILVLLENERVIQKVERELRIGTSASQADALEVLSNLGDRQAARLLVLVHESAPIEERARGVEGLVALPRDLPEIIAVARRSEVRWMRLAASAWAPEEGDEAPEEETMQRLLALKRVGLFQNLSLEQLEAVSLVAQEAEYLPGETILAENEPGEKLYLLLEGEVEIVKDYQTPIERSLAHLTPVAYFGEMAILDNAVRSASAVARSHARLLTLDGPSLKALILQMPEISFAIFPTLTRRVRAAEGRLSEVEAQRQRG